jgi:hypothetical protein
MRASRSAWHPRENANETGGPEPEKNKKREIEVRDLTRKSDVKGGATKANKDEKHASRRTGEVDFMKGRRPCGVGGLDHHAPKEFFGHIATLLPTTGFP